MDGAEELFTPLLGARINRVFHVIVQVGQEEHFLPDTAVLGLDGNLVQLTTDPNWKRSRRMSSSADIVIEGDYEDRTGMELREVHPPMLPLRRGAPGSELGDYHGRAVGTVYLIS